jgi:ATP synthase subunit 6
MYSPLEQFKVNPIVRLYNEWLDITITNHTVYMLTGVILIIIIYKFSIKDNNKLVKGRWGWLIEKFYREVESIVVGILPGTKGKYIPLGIILFTFILFNNLIGIIPYSYTTTAQFIMTLVMSLSIMIGVTLIGLSIHKFRFLNIFIPSGLNEGKIKLIIPLIFVIEVISYLIRVLSLSVRLSANLLSGHTLLKIVANYGLKYTLSLPLLLILPVSLLSAIFLLEIAVSVIQAYVFTLLTLTYISNVYYTH